MWRAWEERRRGLQRTENRAVTDINTDVFQETPFAKNRPENAVRSR